MHRSEAAGAGRCLRWHQTAEDIEHGRRGHCQRTVDVARYLLRGTPEVDLGGTVLHPDPDADIPVSLAVIVHPVFEAIGVPSGIVRKAPLAKHSP